MKLNKHLTRILGGAATAAIVVGFAAPASASPVPPKTSNALLGTWVNTNASTRSVKQVIVAPTRIGNVTVDAFGSCVPTLCEWGRVPANVYGANVSAPTGATFQSNQRFLSRGREWSRTTLFGSVARTRLGLRLTLRELTVFEDGSGRKNYNVTDTFARGRGQQATRNGFPAVSYVRGAPPALAPGAFGTWKNVAATGGLASVRIAGSTANPIVRAFGQCSPTACDWGPTRAITYGPSIASARGTTLLAPYNFGFKKSQLVITYSRFVIRFAIVERLTISDYSEFTDGSGRSNYVMTESFVRS